MKQISILGINFNDFTIESINGLVSQTIESSSKEVILNHNLHSIYLFHKNPEFKRFYDKQTHIHADGMPIILWARLLGYNVSAKNRITYVDWINPLLKLSDFKGYKIFYLGGKPNTGKKAINVLEKEFSNIKFGTHHGYFNVESKEENQKIVNAINEFSPDILLVGMGMPRQELWIDRNLNSVNANVILSSGACFDYISGEARTPPRWLGNLGLEWLYRFIFEPNRLFKRYLIEPIYLIPYFFTDLISYAKIKKN